MIFGSGVIVVVKLFFLRSYLGSSSLLLLVRLLVEVVEQEVEEDGVGQGEAHRPPWEATVSEEKLHLMNERYAELNLLKNSYC